MKIAFNNVQTQPIRHKKRLLSRFSKVLSNGRFFHGAENEILKKRLTQYFGSGYVSLIASGHDSLYMALRAVGCGAGDEVIVPANVYPTAFPVAQTGATPVLVDVDENGLIDPEKVRRAVSKKTKAVVPVHLYGLVVDIPKLKKTLKNKSVKIVEDCAQAFGSIYKNKPVGVHGDLSCFSFYPTKNVGTLGDGGAVWTNSSKYYKYIEAAAAYGETDRYRSRFVSGHSRLPELQAAVLNVYLDHFSKEQKQKRKVLAMYVSTYEKLRLNRSFRMLYHSTNSEPLVHLLVIQAAHRNKLRSHLHKRGIPTIVHYPHGIHTVPAFSHLNHKKGAFPKTEELTATILSLPFHSSLTKEQIEYILKSVNNFYEKST